MKLLFYLISLNIIYSQEIPYFSEKRAINLLYEQCDFGPRHPGSIGHEKMKIYLKNFLTPLCDSLFVMHEEAKNPFDDEIMKLTNFFARYNINAPFRFIIMAHWDSREYADKDPTLSNRKLPVIGANDGASGVAIILSLAEILSKHPVLNIGIDLLLVDGEDQGVSGNSESFGIGTQLFSKHIPNPRPEFAICLDMVADTEQHFLMEQFSLMQAPNIVEEIWTLANDLGYFQFEKKIGHAIMDDHYYLYKHAQIPAIDIIDFDYPNKEINYWHTINDTPDNCSSQSLKTIGIVMTHYIYGKDMEYAK